MGRISLPQLIPRDIPLLNGSISYDDLPEHEIHCFADTGLRTRCRQDRRCLFVRALTEVFDEVIDPGKPYSQNRLFDPGSIVAEIPAMKNAEEAGHSFRIPKLAEHLTESSQYLMVGMQPPVGRDKCIKGVYETRDGGLADRFESIDIRKPCICRGVRQKAL